MVASDRIVRWGIGEHVEMLLESGMKKPKDIARRLNSIESVMQATSGTAVLSKDVEYYLEHRAKAMENRLTKSLRYSPQGQELIAQAQETVGRLMEHMAPVERLLPKGAELLEYLLDRSLLAKQDEEKGREPKHAVVIPKDDIKGLRDLFGLIRDVINDVKSDEKVTQLLRAGQVTFNQQQGISVEEMWDNLIGAARHLECPSCGFHAFPDTAVSAAYSRHRAKAGRESVTNAIDADTVTL